MALTEGDRYFAGQQDSSTPKNLLGEGVISRLINGRFSEGSITNGGGFDELEIRYWQGTDKKVFGSSLTYQDVLTRGDVQLVAPIENIAGMFMIAVISGIMFLIDVETGDAYDITPVDANLPSSSNYNELSYLDNNNSGYELGGYQVIFNYPNLPIFVNHEGARLSNSFNAEMPISRLGATVANRAAIITGDNVLLMSDPLGGASSLAPLTFHQIMDPSTGFTGQKHTIGSSIERVRINALARLPKFLGPSQDFQAQSLLASSKNKKYIIAAGAPRDTWDTMQFILYAGSSEGIAGQQAVTNSGDNVVYISIDGRIKLLAQDQQKETQLQENYFDDALGQFLNKDETNLSFRDWYKTLNHSRSIVKFNKNRLYASVYPIKRPALGRYGTKQETLVHRALAVATMDPKSLVGAQTALIWEGFYDWIHPVGMVTLGDHLYVVSKDEYGLIKYYKSNQLQRDTNISTIYTRGYLSKVQGKSRRLVSGSLFFRKLNAEIDVTISYLSNNDWYRAKKCKVSKNFFKFSSIDENIASNSSSIPIKIDIDHDGTCFELESVIMSGEVAPEEQNR